MCQASTCIPNNDIIPIFRDKKSKLGAYGCFFIYEKAAYCIVYYKMVFRFVKFSGLHGF